MPPVSYLIIIKLVSDHHDLAFIITDLLCLHKKTSKENNCSPPHQSASNWLLLCTKISHESVQQPIWWLVSLHNCLISNKGRSLNTRPNEEEAVLLLSCLLCLLPLTSEALCSAIITHCLHIHHSAGNWTGGVSGRSEAPEPRMGRHMNLCPLNAAALPSWSHEPDLFIHSEKEQGPSGFHRDH